MSEEHPLAPSLAVADLSVGYPGLLEPIIRELSLTLPAGKITALIGPNGSGKSTLLKSMSRVLEPLAGSVLLNGSPVHQQPRRQVARTLTSLPQAPIAPEGLTVRQLCEFGRRAHRQRFGRGDAQLDRQVVDRALQDTGMGALKHRVLESLSGGQRQRAWIAMALAQDTAVMLLDEPTTFLDLAHQLDVLRLLRRLNRDRGRTIVMVLHDLNLAGQFADHLVVVAEQRLAAAGAPWEVLTPGLLDDVFGLRCTVVPSPVDGSPWCLPLAE